MYSTFNGAICALFVHTFLSCMNYYVYAAVKTYQFSFSIGLATEARSKL